MTITQEYIDYIIDQLTGFGAVQARRMFGGAGLYYDGVFFGLIADDTLYFKVDETNKQDYLDAGSAPFQPFGDKSYAMGYYEVPGDILEEPDMLREWAAKAHRVAVMKKKPQKGSTKSTTSKATKRGKK